MIRKENLLQDSYAQRLEIDFNNINVYILLALFEM